jgi:two-component system sensor histidine kinase EvgS
MNGVLIKPLNLMTLENELARHFSSQEIIDEQVVLDISEDYSFNLFSNLLKQNPGHIFLILEEIKKVHIQTLTILKTEPVDEGALASMIHKVKGGAQLLSSQSFINRCEILEIEGSVPDRISAFIQLLEDQNQIIEYYVAKYTSHS